MEINPECLHFSAHWGFFQGHVVTFSFCLVGVVIGNLVRVANVKLNHLIEINVGVEVSHDGEDDAHAQQQAGKQQELYPLSPEITINE